ncbi:hypothetical protein BDV09DRAFT_90887 [Aspergillus tetrazonus]
MLGRSWTEAVGSWLGWVSLLLGQYKSFDPIRTLYLHPLFPLPCPSGLNHTEAHSEKGATYGRKPISHQLTPRSPRRTGRAILLPLSGIQASQYPSGGIMMPRPTSTLSYQLEYSLIGNWQTDLV